MAIAYLSLGTNLGNREANLCRSADLLDERVGQILRKSSIIETEPWGFSSKNKFLNQCVAISTTLEPIELLDETQSIEKQIGRISKTHNRHYSDRLIDIDILLYDDLRIKTDRLIIPHPLMDQREFVMIPLKEILL